MGEENGGDPRPEERKGDLMDKNREKGVPGI